jgi:hypothetical protein
LPLGLVFNYPLPPSRGQVGQYILGKPPVAHQSQLLLVIASGRGGNVASVKRWMSIVTPRGAT